MIKKWFIIYYLGLMPVLTSAQETEIHFHWGDWNGNETLLELGKPTNNQSHVNEPSLTSQLIEPVFEQIREWYYSSDSPDVAGPGFYFSYDLFSSRTFGNNALLLSGAEIS